MRKNGTSGALLVPLLLLALGLGLLLSRSSLGAAARVIVRLALFALLAVAALVVVILVFALTGAKKKPAEQTGAQGADAKLLSQARTELAGYRALAARIRAAEVRSACEPVFAAAERLLQALREQPDELSRVRSFFSYYLPTLGAILKKYEYLERSRALREDLAEQVCTCLAQICTATERLYASLFEDEVIDLTAEMQTLTAVGRKDGLLEDDPIRLHL